jgi:hypothetical protein
VAAWRIPPGSHLLYSVFIGFFSPTKLKTIYSALLFRGITLIHRLSNRFFNAPFTPGGGVAEE